MGEQTRLERFLEFYASGEVPWDDDLPPPEVIDLAEALPPGRALDLGCGYGRSSIYLARHGWRVDGVDFVPQAIDGARRRAAEAGLGDKTTFHVAAATALSFLSGPYDLALDIGCMHSFDTQELKAYRDELARLLRLSGTYLLFAHLGEAESTEEAARWVSDQTIRALFADAFELLEVDYGTTQVADKPPWNSAWYRLRRRAGGHTDIESLS